MHCPSHTASSGDFTLNEAGIYRISYSVVGTNTSGTGNATVELRSDGTAIPGSNKSGTIATASDVVTLAADVLVDAAGTETITLNMVGTGFSFTNAAIVIKKED